MSEEHERDKPEELDPDEKRPQLLYYEEAYDAWLLAPEMVDNIINTDNFGHDGEVIEIQFKRMSFSDNEIAKWPEL